jgi:hypothetical protein
LFELTEIIRILLMGELKSQKIRETKIEMSEENNYIVGIN